MTRFLGALLWLVALTEAANNVWYATTPHPYLAVEVLNLICLAYVLIIAVKESISDD